MPVSTLKSPFKTHPATPSPAGASSSAAAHQPAPGIPGSSASFTGASVSLDGNGSATLLVPTGVTPSNAQVRLSNGLVIPFTSPAVTGSKSVTVTVPPSITFQGTLADTQGNVYSQQQNNASVTFNSPQNPGTEVFPDTSGNYSASVLADQNFTASVFFQADQNDYFYTLPVGTIDHDQTVNVTMPVSTLNVTVQDSSGNPITGGRIQLGSGSINPLPGIPGSSASFTGASVSLDGNGSATLLVPTGVTPSNAQVRLSNGLVIPFTSPAVTGSKSVTVTVPPSITFQGTLADTQGNVYSQQQNNASVTFNSPQNPGTEVFPDTSGNYSASVLADQNFTASVFFQADQNDYFYTLPVGTIDHDQTVNVTMPVSTLNVTVQDSSGNPITGGRIQLGSGSINPLAGIPGSSASFTGASVSLDGNGSATLLVPTGVTPSNAQVRLSNGLVIPFTLHPITANRHALHHLQRDDRHSDR